jgi:predicted nucleotidyltransferase
MDKQIREQLTAVEEKYAVNILYACESGSRAWGFASTDSDWDIRFIYVHPQSWYLSVDLETKRDVIELPIKDDLDFSGWDLRKALKLFYKSNPPLIEWLHSPIIYRDEAGLADRMRKLLDHYYSPRSCYYHYLHMAKGNYREYLKGDTVWLKKYLYVLRPLLALCWMEKSKKTVPVRFSDLLDAVLPNGPIRLAVDQLLAMKKQGMESKHGPAIPEINHFIETEMTRLEQLVSRQEQRKNDIELLNGLFRKMMGMFRKHIVI